MTSISNSPESILSSRFSTWSAKSAGNFLDSVVIEPCVTFSSSYVSFFGLLELVFYFVIFNSFVSFFLAPPEKKLFIPANIPFFFFFKSSGLGSSSSDDSSLWLLTALFFNIYYCVATWSLSANAVSISSFITSWKSSNYLFNFSILILYFQLNYIWI